ncbi:14986_t:CDS:2 [Racocetra fulgida]|uniref:14986_t:CDS:1 n=1 Tax=Racocetra fulgida TaxID=60492 RepID=A0A9N9FMK8_9GLOM|nr:14986_t:CDS:2 [Racocetra fulgida]
MQISILRTWNRKQKKNNPLLRLCKHQHTSVAEKRSPLSSIIFEETNIYPSNKNVNSQNNFQKNDKQGVFQENYKNDSQGDFQESDSDFQECDSDFQECDSNFQESDSDFQENNSDSFSYYSDLQDSEEFGRLIEEDKEFEDEISITDFILEKSFKSQCGYLWLADEQFAIIPTRWIQNQVKVWLMDQPEPNEYEYFVDEIVYQNNNRS